METKNKDRKQYTLESRSENLQEIFGKMPGWLLRCGSGVLLSLIVAVLFMSWLIRYPEIIQGVTVITTNPPPIKIVAKVSGRITGIIRQDMELVKKGDPIAIIQNPLSAESVTYLTGIVSPISRLYQSGDSQIIFNDSEFSFGAIQHTYNELKNNCLDYQEFLTNKYEGRKIEKLNNELGYHREMNKVIEKQIRIAKAEYQHSEEKYAIDTKLFEEKVISKLDFYKEESGFMQMQQTIERLKGSLIQNQITISQMEGQILELEFQKTEKKRNFIESIVFGLDEIRNALVDWQLNYTLTAPISGKLSHLYKISENQFVNTGDIIFSILPLNTDYTAYVRVPFQGFGKVERGQKVLISLANYPFFEYGKIEGIVSKISILPAEDAYWVETTLVSGLVTTFKRPLEFKGEMSGQADIITDDLRLIERVLYNFRSLFRRKTVPVKKE